MTRRTSTLAVSALLFAALAPAAQARITRIDITRVESPTFGGRSFGTVGQFEKLVGTAYGEVKPKDRHNTIIQDIEFAPRNKRGMVEYSADVYIIKPINMENGNRMLFYNVHNRGNKGGLNTFNRGVTGDAACGQNEPVGAGDGFLQNMGYTIIWSGWQPDVLPGNCRITASVPVARNRNGTAITGVVRSELKVGGGATAPATTLSLSSGHFTGMTHAAYPTVSVDNKTPLRDGFLPTLTQRKHVNDAREPIANTEWSFGSCDPKLPPAPDDTRICYPAGFQPGVLYELIYRAKDPTVLGLGWAGMRDLMSFFKHEKRDDAGTANPLFLAPERGPQHDDDDDDEEEDDDRDDRAGTLAVFEGSSQSGRAMRTFLHLGFNEDEEGRIVFEGAFPHIGGGRHAMNIRFAHPGRAWGFTVDHLYPAYEFPFTYGRVHDPITRQTDGILDRCEETETCPKIFHVATALEIWEGRQSLGFTDPLGTRDFTDPSFVRSYIMASTQHGTAAFNPVTGPAFGDCEQQLNPNPQAETMRALWAAFTDWVKKGARPPPSNTPRIADGTFVRPDQVKFPSIPANSYRNQSPAGPANPTVRPAVRWSAVATPLHVLDMGPLFNGLDETGIITREPPGVSKAQYGILVPQVDADGNDLGGIRSTRQQAPLATYTGWNMGRQGRFEDGLCSLSGSYIPFAHRAADRVAGDPRPSIEERYKDHAGYVAAVRAAAQRLVAQRFLLQEDADRLVAEADAGNILR